MDLEKFAKLIIDEMDERFDSFRGEMNTRFESMDARFDAMDARFDRLEEKVDSIDYRLRAVERELGEITRRLDRLEEDVRSVRGFSKEIDDLRVRVKVLETALAQQQAAHA